MSFLGEFIPAICVATHLTILKKTEKNENTDRISGQTPIALREYLYHTSAKWLERLTREFNQTDVLLNLRAA